MRKNGQRVSKGANRNPKLTNTAKLSQIKNKKVAPAIRPKGKDKSAALQNSQELDGSS